MNTFSQSCFYSNRDGFIKLVSNALDDAGICNTLFIVDCMIAQRERELAEKSNVRSVPPVDLQEVFWESPFLVNHQEKSLVAKRLIKILGIQFLGYFVNRSIPVNDIIVSLNSSDPSQAELLFYKWVKGVCNLPNSDSLKFEIFQNLCNSYSGAGFDVLKGLKNEELENVLPVIRSWYSCNKLLDDLFHFESILNLDLLRFLNAEKFYPAIFRKIEAIFHINKKYIFYFSFNSLLRTLEEFEVKEEVLSQLFEEHKDLLEHMRRCFEKDLMECFTSSNANQSLSLVFKLVPDWKQRLIPWTKDEIQKDKENSMDCGRNPEFYHVVKLYKSLEECGNLDQFITGLQQDAGSEFLRDLDNVYKKFREEKKKNKDY